MMVTPVAGQAAPPLSVRQCAIHLCTQTAAFGMVAGGAFLAVRVAFGGDLFFPATVTASCCCAILAMPLTPPTQVQVINQQIRRQFLEFLPKSVRQHLKKRALVVKIHSVTMVWTEFMRWPPISKHHQPHRREYVQVRALTNGDQLIFEASNLKTRITTSGKIQVNGSVSEMMQLLKNSYVTLEDDGIPAFSLAYHTFSCEENRTGKKTHYFIALLSRQKDLVWNIFDYSDPANVTAILTKDCHLSDKCSFVSRRFFRTNGSLEEQIRQKREYILAKFDPEKNKISVEPIHTCSFFQGDILVSKFMWAVTLIRNKGPSGNHAQIIVEGVNDGYFTRYFPESPIPVGKYFMYLADLVGDMDVYKENFVGIIKKKTVRDIRTALKSREFRLKYEGRSNIWKRSSDRVKAMIDNIQTEKANPPPGFAIYGRKSIFRIFASKKDVKDSCITWAMDKLKDSSVHLQHEASSFLYTNTSIHARHKPNELMQPSTGLSKLIDVLFFSDDDFQHI
jgi:hypothetical protein